MSNLPQTPTPMPELPQGIGMDPVSQAHHSRELRKKILIVGMIIWGILLAGYGYAKYISWQNYNTGTVAAEKADQDIAALKEKRAASSSDISNWKTYTNTQYGFSFAYPKRFEVQQGKTDFGDGQWRVGNVGVDGDSWLQFEFEIVKSADQNKYYSKTNIAEQAPLYSGTFIRYNDEKQDLGSMSVYIQSISSKDQTMIVHSSSDYLKSTEFGQIISTFKFTSDAAGQHCGGNIKDAPTCPSDYICQLNRQLPDAGGTCVKNSTQTDTLTWIQFMPKQCSLGYTLFYPTGFSVNENADCGLVIKTENGVPVFDFSVVSLSQANQITFVKQNMSNITQSSVSIAGVTGVRLDGKFTGNVGIEYSHINVSGSSIIFTKNNKVYMLNSYDNGDRSQEFNGIISKLSFN